VVFLVVGSALLRARRLLVLCVVLIVGGGGVGEAFCLGCGIVSVGVVFGPFSIVCSYLLNYLLARVLVFGFLCSGVFGLFIGDMVLLFRFWFLFWFFLLLFCVPFVWCVCVMGCQSYLIGSLLLLCVKF
jgi:hypothetical protein